MQAKRWLSGLVACAMLVTMLPTQVFALESDAADTWSKTLNAEELYALIQDKLDENGSIGLADLADSEAGTDTNDGVQGTLTAVAFDNGDKIELSALADGDTSYTLTFTGDDTSEPDSGLPAETGDMTEPPQEDGQPVAPGATPADDSTASDTTSGTDPPTAEEPSAQGQEGTVDLRVTTQETYATEAEADAQAAEQGKDPEADVAVQTDEATGTVLGALLTVDEEQVDKVTLTYTEIAAEDDAISQDNEEPQAEDGTPTEEPAGLEGTNALQTAKWGETSIHITIEEGSTKTISKDDLGIPSEAWKVEITSIEIKQPSQDPADDVVDVQKARNNAAVNITGLQAGTATVTVEYTYGGVIQQSGSATIQVTVTDKKWSGLPGGAIPEDTADGATVVETTKVASNAGEAGQWDITMTATAEQDLTQQSQEVVLLLDTSGSMAWCTDPEHEDKHVFGGYWCANGDSDYQTSRMEVAQKAAKELINTLAKRGLNVKVAVTGFSSDGYRVYPERYHEDSLVELSESTVSQMNDAIDDLSASGGTNMLKGLEEAADAFSSDSTKKTIIMLADGDYDDNASNPVPYANALKDANISIYTVGFMADNTTLGRIASDQGHYFTADNTNKLLENFQTIANQLSAMINDPLGDDVSLVGDANNVQVSIAESEASSKNVSQNVKYDAEDNLITWNPDLEEDIDSGDIVNMTYKVEVNPDKIEASESVQSIALNGNATFNYFYTDDGEATYAGSASFDPPTGYYTAGQLVEKYVDEAGKPIDGMSDQTSAPVIVSWGTEENNLEPSNAQFTWTTPTMPEGYVSVKTYKADNFEDIQEENLLTETSMTATAGTTTIYHVFSKEPVQKNSQIKVEVYLDGNTKAESNSSEYVNVYNTKNGIDTVVSRKEDNLYEFQYETYNSMDTKITLVKDSQYVIDAVETGVIKGETSFNANESYVKSTEAKIDNVAGTDLDNNVVTVYLRTKYSVAYYKDGEPLNNYEDNTIYVAAREAGAKTSYNDYTTSEDNNKSPLSTKVQSAGLSTTISLKDLPEVGTDKTISGWFATEIVQPDEVNYQGNTNVSEHANRVEAGVIPFYARTADATATLTVQAVNEEGEPLTVDDPLPKSVQVTIGEPYTVVIGTSTDATITAPMTFTVDGTHYAYMELGENSAALMGTMPADGATVTLVYGVDEIGGDDPEKPGDGIPDQYQFTIEYVVADGQKAMGSVSPVGQNVYTIYQDGVLSAGPVTVSIDGDVIKAGVATAQDGYVFENWTLNDVDLSAIGVDDDLTGYQMMGVTGGQTYTFVAHFTKNYTVQDVLNSFVKRVTLADGVENFPASAEFKFALTKEGGSPTYEATTGEVSGMTAERSIPIVTDATDILADGTYYLTETVMDAGWTLTTPADGYKITIDHGTMSVNDKEGETFAFVNTYNGAPSLEVEKTVVDAKGNPVSDDAVYRDGDQVYFKIAVTAKGGWPVEDVTVTDTLPAGLTVDAQAIQYPEFHNFQGSLTNVDGKKVEIRINTATPTEDTVWVIIPAIVDVPETYDEDAYTNIAVIDDGNQETEDPNGEATIRVAALDVQKTLVDNSKVYNVGDTVKYQITFKNIGNVTLKEFDIADAVPNGLEIVDSAWENGKFNDLLPDELQPGEEKAVTVEVRITDYSASYSNTATVTAETAPGGKPVTKDDTNTDLKVNPNHNVTVQYVLQDEAGKTVSAIDKGTLTAAHNSTWKVSVADQEDLTDAGNLQVPKTTTTNGIQYVFKQFATAQTSGTVTGNVEITVVYGLDEIGGGSDQKQPDGIPDEYQATVTYRVVNGTWSDGSSTDRTEVFTLYTYDPATAAWTEIEHVTLGNTIPTGMQANAGYAGQSGAWNTAITAETQVTGNVTYIYRFGEAAPDEIIVYYDDDGSGYGEVTSEHRQVFTADNWQTITGDPTHVRIHLTATAEDDGGRTYFDEWQGSLVDDLDDDIREDEELSAWVVAEIGQTYTVIADFGRRSSGGGGGGGNRDDDDDEEEIIDEEVPLAETPWLNTVDHYAYIVGYAEDGTVRPNANITRAEVATIFFRLLTDEARNSLWSTTNTFSDVASTAWYNTAVSTMANAGIIQGYEDGTFRPNANITRAEFAAIAARFMTSGYDVESDLFTDIAGHWARESINDAATAGWINGYSDDTFRPDNAITRAEAVTLVNNVLQRKPDADHMLDSMITWPDNPESAWYYEAIQEATNSHDYDMPSEDDDVDYETWTALQENRDWAALEAQWSAEHAYGGDVM